MDEERRKESQRLHQESQRLYDKEQNALCYLVIGATLLIIGILFIFLAYKRENNELVGIDYTSIAFYIMIISMVTGLTGLIYGAVRFFIALNKRSKVIKQINSLK